MDLTEEISEYIQKINIESYDGDTIEMVKLLIADYFAASFAGMKVNRNFNECVISALREAEETGMIKVSITEERFSVITSAYINALYAHGADMDDGNRMAAGHIGAHVISAVFALAQERNVFWSDVFEAVIAGYEVFNWVSGEAQPTLYQKGFHSTGVAGGIASAVACAKLLHLDKYAIYNSISLGALQSSGLIIIDESGQCCKSINPANAARIGIMSALMAEKGVVGPRNVLESKKGWFSAYADIKNKELKWDCKKSGYSICDCYIKLYPTCRHTHACIDAMIELSKELKTKKVVLEDITEITVYVYASAIRSAGKIKYPKDSGEAKFSIYYACAIALLKQNFGLSDIETIDIACIEEIVEKMRIIEDNSLEDRVRGIRGCRICIVDKNGQIYERTIEIPKGEGKKRILWEDMNNKMLQCARGICEKNVIDELIWKCNNIVLHDKYENLY